MENKTKKRMLIYDTSKGFHRFMKLNFTENYIVDSFFDFKDSKDIIYEDYCAIFFIINESSEVLDLISIYSKDKSIFVGTRLGNVTQHLQNIEDITILDLIQSRHSMIDFINFHLKLFTSDIDN
jgi:hypothetical protein